MSQSQAILEDLRSGRRLTPKEALERHGCFRLAARVRDLRDAGWPIETEMVEQGGARFAAYVLKVEPKQESWL